MAQRSKISVQTLRRMEAAEGAPNGYANNIFAVIAALVSAGVIFIDENGEGPGVRLKKRPLAVAEITEKIEALDQTIATLNVEGEPSPETGMNQLRKALAKNQRTKLKNRRAMKSAKPK
ncbi:hypothetical protein [Methylocapsa palsarum]|uniref:hypothetical protein n=1 Tax=Methylocapsa palsarum TaxID=1612308 RepID=UPI003CC7A4AC